MRKIAIVGAGPTRSQAPTFDTNWDIYTCSPRNMNVLDRVTCWFELHGDLDTRVAERPDWAIYVDWLRRQSSGILSFSVYAYDKTVIPNAIPFQYRDCLKEFGPYFFTSSFAWMMAKALIEKADTIGLYGIDLTEAAEYEKQRPGAHFFIQEAQRRGVQIVTPPQCNLLQPGPLYGYSSATRQARTITAWEKQATEALTTLRNQQIVLARDAAQLNVDIARLEGVLESAAYLKKTVDDTKL